jgi:hypothetical protein
MHGKQPRAGALAREAALPALGQCQRNRQAASAQPALAAGEADPALRRTAAASGEFRSEASSTTAGGFSGGHGTG